MSRKEFFFIIVNSLILCTIQTMVLHYHFHFSWAIACLDGIIYAGLSSTVVFALQLISVRSFTTLPQWRQVLYLVPSLIVFNLVTLLSHKLILEHLFVEEASYLLFLNDGLLIRFIIYHLITGGTIEWGIYRKNIEELKEKIAHDSKLVEISKETELKALYQQLQPHFIFNSLNSINSLIAVRPEEAQNMIIKLSDFLRGTLRSETQPWSKIEDEMEHLNAYLDIEKIRFSHRLQTSIVIDESCKHVEIPTLLLQPVVENAIKFGLYNTTDAVTIDIEIKKTDPDYVTIIVSNPFENSTEKPKGTGFGLSSLKKRLQLVYGRNDLFQVHTSGNIFTSTLQVPFETLHESHV